MFEVVRLIFAKKNFGYKTHKKGRSLDAYFSHYLKYVY